MNKNRFVRLTTAFLAVLACFLTTGAAQSAPGALLWEDTVDVGNFDQAFDVAALKDRVFVAGFVGSRAGGRDFLLRAYDSRDGNLLWQDQVDKGPNDFASGVVAAGKMVFVSGAVGSFCCPDWLVRAHDAETGRLLWEDRFDRSGRSDSPRPGVLAVSKGLLFVAGAADTTSVWVVRAYDTATGALAWQDHFDTSGITGAESLVVRRGRVFVGGFCDTDVENLCVRAHDARTGTLLWQQTTIGGLSGVTTLRGLDSDGKRVFAAGTLANAATNKLHFLVQAYDAETGALLWQDQVDKGGDVDSADGIAVQGRRVFATGEGGRQCLFEASPPSNCDVIVRSYDRKTGALLWEKESDAAGLDDKSVPGGVLATKGRVFVLGEATTSVGNIGDWLVQAFHGARGDLLWEDLLDTGGGVNVFGAEIPLALALLDGRLFVVGRTVDATDNWNFTVRAYDAGDEQPEDDDDNSDDDHDSDDG